MTDSRALSTLLDAVKASGFGGDIETDYAARIVASTDNSIYQLPPLAIFYPATGDDINRVMRCVHAQRKDGFSITARGGGTGTNGQSLSDNLVLDCSRYLTHIDDFDVQQQTVSVEPGVVLDQLNRHLQDSGLFFPIDISSSSRATLGGMVATDASGKGSLIYGKTSHHVDSLDVVLNDGSDFHASAMSLNQLDTLQPVYQKVSEHSAEIDRVFPQMDRGLTGYNLKQAIEVDGQFNPCFLFSGSEGTLAISKRITLRLSKCPTHKMLCVVFYDDFQRALEHVQTLLPTRPAAIEMLDDKVLALAKNDSIWNEVKTTLDGLPDGVEIKATNFIEFSGFSAAEMAEHKKSINSLLNETGDHFNVIHFETENDPVRIAALWNLRKRAVGLLGKLPDNKKGVAFVEDTAVPPQNLAAYVADFRRVLEQHQLEYGMYGHADAGVLHVRPVLDLMQPQQRKLIRKISDIVAQLALQHGGVLWGEHGRGFRGEYTPLFFGEELYPVLCDIKKHFDPFNLLNPGKLTTPEPGGNLTALDQVPLRAALDAEITIDQRTSFDSALACNGNGACYNADLNDAMCPSYKATRNKIFSPKGRAALLREWAHLQSKREKSGLLSSIEPALFDSLQHCLSCKSCTAQCPVNVDIPEMKSRFLEQFYRTQGRPWHAIFTRYFETLLAAGRKLPRISNLVLKASMGTGLFQRMSKLDRLPSFSVQAYEQLEYYSPNLPFSEKAVILLRDNYLDSFDRQTLQAAADVLNFFGYKVYLSPLIDNGKLLHVKGYRNEFKKRALATVQQVTGLAETGLPLISCETVTRLMFDKEYPQILEQKFDITVHSIEAFLLKALHLLKQKPTLTEQRAVTLLPHCMEQTTARDAAENWSGIFTQLDIPFHSQPLGCCGMSGQFGHEVENQELSEKIYQLRWKPTLESAKRVMLASGFSCRCQGENHNQALLHPVVYLKQLLIG
jgi:FAD/FMN-containing dehydrogenase/Fe-S oxidoreductase